MSEQSGIKPSQSFNNQQAMDDEIDLRHLIAMLLDGRFIIGGVIAVAFALAIAYVVTATPIY
ncbi:MAG: Wzz/FepE/Etk N-terminal domain-containing protein, partial [Porticoccaceae bacterium]